MSLCGRLAVVTGGGSGIGKAVCHALAGDGAAVVVTDINLNAARATVAELKGAAHIALPVDVGDLSSVAALFGNISSQCRTPLSILVHCAGVLKRCTVVDMSEEDFDEQLRVNLKGTFLVNQAAVKIMTKSQIPEGCIVNIASIAAKGGYPTFSAYAASKCGVVAFTKSLAQELAGTNIRVNALLPGLIDTPMTADWPEDMKETTRNMCPLKRFAQPEEVADVAKYLCTSGSSYITGTSVEVAGGMYA